MDGGDADAGGVEAEVRRQQRVDGRVAGDGESLGGLSEVGIAGVDDGDKLDEVWMRGLELAVDAEVVAAEGTGPDDGYASGRQGYFFVSEVGDSTASRQRA